MRDPASLDDAIATANAFLAQEITPLQAGRIMQDLGVYELPYWSALGGASGPLSAFYGAADDASRNFFIGDDVERWHPDVRERRRAEIAQAEDNWRDRVEYACRALVEHHNLSTSDHKAV